MSNHNHSKVCKQCSLEKSIDQFYHHNRRWGIVYDSECKECKLTHMKEQYRIDHPKPERILEFRRQNPLFGPIEVPLTKSFIALIDIDDADLTLLKWSIASNGYAIHGDKSQKMHRIILERIIGRKLERTEQVDHIDGDRLNNQRSNLRVATPTQNTQNQKLKSNNRSGYKGVYWENRTNKWVAQITVNKKRKCLGRFDDPAIAYEAYKEAAVKYFGKFARLR